MSRKAVKGVLHNFLETYTSRYSDFDGYWLFGMLIDELEHFSINLLDPNSKKSESALLSFAMQLAGKKFKEQMENASLSLSCVREAKLTITKSPDLRKGYVNGHVSDGFDLTLTATAALPSGKEYECEKSIFVAPHDPEVELRSARGT